MLSQPGVGQIFPMRIPPSEMPQPSGYCHIVDARHHAPAREVVAELVKLNVRKARESPALIPDLVGILPMLMDLAICSFGRRKQPWRIRRLPHVHVSKVGFQLGAEINGSRFAVLGLPVSSNVEALSVKIDIRPPQP